MGRRPTVYDVAAEAGVSIATVSFAFTQPKRVRKSTLDAVLAAAHSLGYVPSANARGLATGLTGAIGLYSFDYQLDSVRGQRSPQPATAAETDIRRFPLYVDEVQRGVQLECRRRGYALMLGAGHNPENLPDVIDIAGRVDGLIAFAGSAPPEAIVQVSKRIPVVELGGEERQAGVRIVFVDNHTGMRRTPGGLGARHRTCARRVRHAPALLHPRNRNDRDQMTISESPALAPPATSPTNQWPVIAGFYPDPSICRAGDDYYLATSSFEYFPGVPLFHSRNLVDWEQIGNVLDRPSQLLPGNAAGSGGIFAPTLRYHGGRFWLITTDVSRDSGHLLVTASDPRGPWSDPLLIEGTAGIDPDIAWDEAGECYVTWRSNDLAAIAQAAVDPVAGTLLESPRLLWTGTGLAWPEAPHLYHRDGWWYLLIAEGGTERGHCVSVARSRSIKGPFAGALHNPVFSHRSTQHPVQNVGHADLIQRPDGEWAAVYLGTRPRGTTPGFHVNGRETFLAGIDWVDGWPSFDAEHFTTAAHAHSFIDDFRSPRLHPRWVSPNAAPEDFVGRDRTGALHLRSGSAEGGEAGILALRVRDEAWSANARVSTDGTFRFVLRIDDRHWCALDVDSSRISARLRIGPLEAELGSASHAGSGPIILHIRAGDPTYGGPDDIELGADSGLGYRRLASFDGRYLSTEVAGGFTGRVIGLQARSGAVTVHEIRYTS